MPKSNSKRAIEGRKWRYVYLKHCTASGKVYDSHVKSIERDNRKKRVETHSGIKRRGHSLGRITSKSSTQACVMVNKMITQAEKKMEAFKEELAEVVKYPHIAWNRNREIELKNEIENQKKWIDALKM